MVPSLIQHAVEIKLKFETLPPLIDDMELACAIGMGYHNMGQPVPSKKESLAQMQEDFMQAANTHMDLTDEKNKRLLTLISRYHPSKALDDLHYHFLLYGADAIQEFEA